MADGDRGSTPFVCASFDGFSCGVHQARVRVDFVSITPHCQARRLPCMYHHIVH